MVNIWYNKQKSQYCVDLKLGGKPRRVFLGKDKEAAEKRLNEILKRKDAVEGGAVSLVELAENYLEWVQKNKTTGTYDVYRRQLSTFVKIFKDRLSSEIRPVDVEKLKADMAGGGLSNATINQLIGITKAMMNWACRMGYLTSNPIAFVRALPATPPRDRVISLDEEKRLLAVCENDLRNIITVFLQTGLRISELCNLTWNDINLERREIIIRHRKNSTTATNPTSLIIPIGEPVLKVLMALKCREGHVFLNQAGNAYDKDILGARIRSSAKKAGLEGVTAHTFRHSVATRLVQAGESLSVVARLLGHTTEKMTSRYAHLQTDDVREALTKLPASSAEEPEAPIIPLRMVENVG